MGNSSSRPNSISAVRTIFASGEKAAKQPVGPTSPRPGPMLFSVAITAVKVVTKSRLSSATSSTDTIVTRKYRVM